MLDVPHTTQKPKNFFWTGNNWQLLGFLGGWNDLRQAPILMERYFVKETKSCYGEDDGAWSELPLVGQVELVRTDLLRAQQFR
jgi:hypothetical protein